MCVPLRPNPLAMPQLEKALQSDAALVRWVLTHSDAAVDAVQGRHLLLLLGGTSDGFRPVDDWTLLFYEKFKGPEVGVWSAGAFLTRQAFRSALQAFRRAIRAMPRLTVAAAVFIAEPAPRRAAAAAAAHAAPQPTAATLKEAAERSPRRPPAAAAHATTPRPAETPHGAGEPLPLRPPAAAHATPRQPTAAKPQATSAVHALAPPDEYFEVRGRTEARQQRHARYLGRQQLALVPLEVDWSHEP